MLDDLRMFLRFAAGLRTFLDRKMTLEEARRIHADSFAQRSQSFLTLLRGVYGAAGNPYRALLRWAGVEYGDLERMVRQDGVEAALEKLYDGGVHVSLEEFKGRRPLERKGLYLQLREGSFDNPLARGAFEVRTGGSTGRARRLAIDFELMAYDAACKMLNHSANGALGRPYAIWKAVPPGSSGLKNALWSIQLGAPLAEWFSPTPISWRPDMWKSAVFTYYALAAARWRGCSIPYPKHVPLDRAGEIAAWLAGKARASAPVVISLSSSRAVRVCMAAKEMGLDLSGTVFRVGGEPFTAAKQRLIEEAGARAFSGWAMAECGPLAGGCANPSACDEVHLFLGKIAVIQRPKLLADGQSRLDALYLTTLLPSAPKIMLNLDTGDYGVLSQRDCGCGLQREGLTVHLHTIRSYEKLTTGGMHFLGGEFVTLVEEVLPKAFGGSPIDYQFVEEERGPESKVRILISPRVGPVEESKVVGKVLNYLASRSRGDRSMAWHWQQSGTLSVSREEPAATKDGKIPHLRVVRL
ncbi:MAG: hypothetical protein K6T61_05360 [Bryobacteraceae bacterium]|nr:hypothetical protein [Bryobacteraceae bacterium]